MTNHFVLSRALSVLLAAAFAPGAALAAPATPAALAARVAAAVEAKDALGAYAVNRLLVVPSAGLSPSNLAAIVGVHGGRAHRVGKSTLNIVDLPAGVSAKAVLARLAKHPHLKRVELDRKVRASATANDPYFASQYHLAKTGVTTAWNTTQGAGVTIAILDSGVDSGHPDLAANMLAGYNFVDNNTNVADVCGHGTAVAGSAAAVSNNSQGVAGVAGQAKILPVRIASSDGSGGCTAYVSTIVSGITYAADRGARIVNLSYGPLVASAAIQNAASYLKSKGGLLFVSAGNSGADLATTPTPTMVVVSATDAGDSRASWSNFGSAVTLAAPGAGIWTTSRGASYGTWNGTSFSAPVAAGVGALVMAANPALTNQAVENLLYSTATDLGAAGRDTNFGYGRVDAAAAVAAAVPKVLVADTTAPSAAIASPGAGATVSGLVAVNVNAADNVGVQRVELKVNGAVVGSDTGAPYQFSWDSAGVPNGVANLVAVAYDAAGNAGASASVGLSVANAVAPAPATWINCANEGGICSFTGTRQVRYGANNSYAFQNATGSIACTNAVFGDPMPATAKSCQYSSAPLTTAETWTTCANEWGTCSFSGTREVRYGGKGVYASKIITATTPCTNAVFGDPIKATAKTCEYSSITR